MRSARDDKLAHLATETTVGVEDSPEAAADPQEEAIATEPPAGLGARWAAVRGILSAHRLIAIAVVVGAIPRLGAILGYRPAMWFTDSFEYLAVARRWEPYRIRPNGYPLMLRLLEPFHSFALVTLVQHAMGLAIAVLIYALLRHWGLPAWLATLGALPQLFDGNQVELEHFILSDTLFTLLLVGGVVLLCWRAKPTTIEAGAAGLLLATATLTRTVGLPLVALGLVWLLARRVGWRAVLAFAVLAAVPLLGYASWFRADNGQFALTTSDGVFLYSRVAIFADCKKIDPPERLAMICQGSDPDTRGDVSSNFLWHPSPLDKVPGANKVVTPEDYFTAVRNTPASEFARATILAQPFDYLRVGTHDIVRTFQWAREPFPNFTAWSQYPFGGNIHEVPSRVFVRGADARQDSTAYEHGAADTRRVQPFADWMAWYQKLTAVRGPFLLVIFLAGAAGVVLAIVWRRTVKVGPPLTLFWLVTAALIVVPPFTAQYDLRYVIPAVPMGAVAVVCTAWIVLDRLRALPEGDGTASMAPSDQPPETPTDDPPPPLAAPA
jgi:hypothetical protein